MRELIIPLQNWAGALAAALDKAQSGDTVVVASESMAELARRAVARKFPEKTLTITVRQPSEE